MKERTACAIELYARAVGRALISLGLTQGQHPKEYEQLDANYEELINALAEEELTP